MVESARGEIELEKCFKRTFHKLDDKCPSELTVTQVFNANWTLSEKCSQLFPVVTCMMEEYVKECGQLASDEFKLEMDLHLLVEEDDWESKHGNSVPMPVPQECDLLISLIDKQPGFGNNPQGL
ncbi:hypothetical protein Ddc_14596 [Ditylenchus destructor]|nr:hypothetical protein Ddc_14596 [Ditylenchus destructor]